MEVTIAKFGIDRIPANKEEVLRHREMPLLDVLLEKKTPLSFRDISYNYDVGIIVRHVNRPLAALVTKEQYPRLKDFDSELTSALAMEEHAKLWTVPDSFKHMDEIVGLVNCGYSLNLMRGLVPQPIVQIGTFYTYTPDYDSRVAYAVYIKDHEKFGLSDPFDSQHIFYSPTNVSSNVTESKGKMVCLTHSASLLSNTYRETINRMNKYFPDVDPMDYVKILSIDITDMATGFLSDHANDLEYYVGQVGGWRFVNIDIVGNYVQSHPNLVTILDFNALNKEGIRFDLGEFADREFSDIRHNDFMDTIEDESADGVGPGHAKITVDFLVDQEEDVFKERMAVYRAVVKFKEEDHSFIPNVGSISDAIGHLLTRSILNSRKDLTGQSFYVNDPILDNFTSSGFDKATKNELVYYGTITNAVNRDIIGNNTRLDNIVRNRHMLVSFLKQYAVNTGFKWVGLTDLIRQNVPVEDRARFYAAAMEIIRIENNSIIVNDFVYRWLDGYVYLAYVGRINDIKITTDDINRLRSKLLSPVTDGSELPDLKRLKFVRDAEHQDEVLYGWDWYYILEDGKYRKVKGYVLTERNTVNGCVNPNVGARVTLRDPDGVDTSLFLDPYHLSKGLVITDALAPVGGIYQLNDHCYVQVIV